MRNESTPRRLFERTRVFRLGETALLKQGRTTCFCTIVNRVLRKHVVGTSRRMLLRASCRSQPKCQQNDHSVAEGPGFKYVLSAVVCTLACVL